MKACGSESQVRALVCLEVAELEDGQDGGGDGEEGGVVGHHGLRGGDVGDGDGEVGDVITLVMTMAPPASGSSSGSAAGHSFSSVSTPSAFFTRSMWALG